AVLVVDVRERDEFEGTRTAECDPRKGRIPGAIHVPRQLFLGEDGRRLRADASLRDELGARGLEPRRNVIVYCHRGARSAVAWAGLRILDVPKVRNYIGSWHEWGRRPDLPVEKG